MIRKNCYAISACHEYSEEYMGDFQCTGFFFPCTFFHYWSIRLLSPFLNCRAKSALSLFSSGTLKMMESRRTCLEVGLESISDVIFSVIITFFTLLTYHLIYEEFFNLLLQQVFGKYFQTTGVFHKVKFSCTVVNLIKSFANSKD